MAAGMKRIRFRSDDVRGLAPGLASSLSAQNGEAPEETATRYLHTLFGAPDVSSMSLSDSDPAVAPVLEVDATIDQPLTDTKQVSYQQTFRTVPVHGAIVGVEMADDGSLVGIDGQIADVGELDPLPRISPDRATELAAALATDEQQRAMPSTSGLVVRFDDARDRWALAYVFRGLDLEDLPAPTGAGTEAVDGPERTNIQRHDLFLDAHDGHEVVRVPLVHHAMHDGKGSDALGRLHTFPVESANGKYVLRDETRPISTHTLGYGTWQDVAMLPGAVVSSDTTTFSGPGVSAHGHALRVLDYFERVFKRRGIDGRGGKTISCVDCIDQPGGPRSWGNAAWVRVDSPEYPKVIRDGVMVYGQIPRSTPPPHEISIAEGLEIVAHELMHGVTDYAGGLEYVTESGALNESYSDIFGCLILNDGNPNPADWDWEIGRVLFDYARPLRSLENPRAHGQPDHYAQRKKLAPGEKPSRWNDNGWVHANSGVHNKAAYNLLVSGALTPVEVSTLFYLTLTTPGRLSRTATFADSRDGLVASADTLYRKKTVAERDAKIAAIRTAFASVGL